MIYNGVDISFFKMYDLFKLVNVLFIRMFV